MADRNADRQKIKAEEGRLRPKGHPEKVGFKRPGWPGIFERKFKMQEIHIDKTTEGGRLDKLLIKYFDRTGQGFVYKMLRKKNITLNDKKSMGADILKEGDVIKLYLADDTISKFSSAAAGKGAQRAAAKGGAGARPEIVYEDENIVAINKPQGMLSQKVKNSDCSVNDFLKEIVPGTDFFKPGISNRLDRNTSGIILAGKNPAAARELNRAVKERSISKKYLCVISGKIEGPMEISGFLQKDEKTNTVLVTDDRKEGACEIRTAYRPLAVSAFTAGSGRVSLCEKCSSLQEDGESGSQAADSKSTELRAGDKKIDQTIYGGYKEPDFDKKSSRPRTEKNNVSSDEGRAGQACLTLLEVDLITGRSHQIRAHLAHIGHPVAGDAKYGDASLNSYAKKKYGIKAQLLHAYRVEFNSMKGILEYLNGTAVTADPPANMIRFLEGENLWQPGVPED